MGHKYPFAAQLEQLDGRNLKDPVFCAFDLHPPPPPLPPDFLDLYSDLICLTTPV